MTRTRLTALACLLLAAPASPEPARSCADRVRPPAVCFAPGTTWKYVEETLAAQERAESSLFRTGGRSEYQFSDSDRWSSTALSGFGLAQGDPTIITWSYLSDGVVIPSAGVSGEGSTPSNLRAWLDGIYGDFDTWHAIFVGVFARWSNLSGVTYVYEPNDDGASFPSAAGLAGVRGDVRIGAHTMDGTSGVLAYNYYPNTGDMVFDSADATYNNTATDSLILRNVIAHEHGHGLGIEHVCPVNQTKLMEPFLATSFDGPQHDDQLAGQRGYGDPDEPNNTALTATPVGPVPGGVTATGRSIDDDSDVDFLSFEAPAGATLDVTLSPTGFTYLQGPQNFNGSCSAGTSFNSSTTHDLEFSVLAPDGVTVLTTVDANGAGSAETLSGFTLASGGTYYLRINGGAANGIQLYSISLGTDTGCSVSAGADTSVCPGGSVGLAAMATGVAPIAYSWTPILGLDDPSSATPTATPTLTTTYTVTITDDDGCMASDSVTVTVAPPTVTAGGAGSICPGGSRQLTATPSGGTPPYGYSWSPATGLSSSTSATPTASPTMTTTYTVTLTDASGCTDTDSATVTVTGSAAPSANAGPDRLACDGPVQLAGSASGGTSPYTWSWSPSLGLTGTTVQSPDANPPWTTTYSLIVTGADDCASSADTVTVTVGTTGTFADVAHDSFFSGIETLYAHDITGGCLTSPLRYCPGNAVTRAEMAAFLVRAMGASLDAGTSCFSDVSPASGFAPYICKLASLGVTSGCGSGRYCPQSAVTRAEMAKFLLKAIGATAASGTSCFGDVPSSSGFASYICELAARAITGGCATNPPRYCPDAAVTRAQMAVFLSRAFELAPVVDCSAGAAPPSGEVFPEGAHGVTDWTPAGDRIVEREPAPVASGARRRQH